MIDLTELRAVASAATEGPWEWGSDRWLCQKGTGRYGDVIETGVSCMAYCYGGTGELVISPEDRAFMETFSPDVVLALLAEVESLRAQMPPMSMVGNRVRGGE